MKDESPGMSEQTYVRSGDADREIELLARETHMPRNLVATIYSSERTKLERTARIKTYVPVLIRRRVKAVLREQRRARA
jgi:hypothetical protein